MSITLSSIVTSLDAYYGDTSRGSFTNARILEFLNSSVRELRTRYDLPTSEYRTVFDVWNDVNAYAIPSGYKSLVSLKLDRYMDDRTEFEDVDDRFFWRESQGRNLISEERNGMSRRLLISLRSPAMPSALLHACNTYNGNGTWTAFGDATNVRTDSQYYRSGNGSVMFDLTVSTGQGGIQITDMSPVDLSSSGLSGIATLIPWFYFSSFTSWTSIKMRWGQDASNYWESTVTKAIDSNAFSTGWNQTAHAWTSATKTGSPTSSNIKYLRLELNFPVTTSNQTGIRVDEIWARTPLSMRLAYLSDYLVTSAAGAAQEDFSSMDATTETLNVDPSFKDLLVFRVLEKAYAFVKPNALSLQQVQAKLQKLDEDLLTRFPSKRSVPYIDYADRETPNVYG